jgi:2-polyprenyl-3-methyl-5-hydroxy-6-metoxy-1,4-benzoquinol methylase
MSKKTGFKKPIIIRGGKDGERLYLKNIAFKMSDGSKVIVKKTNEPGANMTDSIARHKGRYGLLTLFSRPGFKLLDFPCGSGISTEVLRDYGITYYGYDIDAATIEYARRVYRNKKTFFRVGDLCSPRLKKSFYDIIGCIEGLEHIEKNYQKPLIDVFYEALKPGGIFIVSSPENVSGVSGPSKINLYHKWELNKEDFLSLLNKKFGRKNVEILTYRAILTPGLIEMVCFFGICRKNV